MVASVRQGLNNAGIKVTDLPVATTPLTGAEVMMMVQSGLSKQAPLSDILAGIRSTISVAVAAGATNDWAPVGKTAQTRLIIVSTAAGNAQITGLLAGIDLQDIVILNAGPNQLRLDKLTASAAANQFRATSNLVLLPDSATEILYSLTNTKWIVIP